MTPLYPTLRRLAQATPEQLWEWYARLPAPRTPAQRKVLVETMRRLNLVPGHSSPEDRGGGEDQDGMAD